MTARLLRWGNSLAIRIPKAFVDEMKIRENASLEMTMYEGALIIMPNPGQPWSLPALLAEVTEANKPGEWETGGPEGTEEW